ncbi:MAG: PAS domain S-box protein, partial [Gemmatimonadales bacterium]|nr:PAS domain S-box protein [Gemmatimonadales bacterium]
MQIPDYLSLSVFEQCPVGMVWTDLKERIVFVNTRFCEQTGYLHEELLGKNVELLKSGRHSEKFHANISETLRSGREWVGRIENKRKDGTLYSAKATITPIRHPETGEVTHYASTQEDLAQCEELEARLRQSQRFESLGVLAGGIAHEFNNILTPLFGYLDLIRTAAPSPQAHRYVDHAERSAQRARQLISQILAFSRQVDQGDERVDLRLIVKESLKLAQSLFPSTVDVRCGVGSSDLSVVVDPELM